MATTVSVRPVPVQKMKRPPLPMVQTSMNGVKSSQSSPSPSLSSKRPPPGFKHPPNVATTNGASGTPNAAGPRISNRRKESQRPGDSISRPPRSARLGTGDGAHTDRKFSKRMPEPHGIHKHSLLRIYVRLYTDTVLYSENYSIYAQKVSQSGTIACSPPASHAFQIRTTGWQFLVQLPDEDAAGACEVSDNPT